MRTLCRRLSLPVAAATLLGAAAMADDLLAGKATVKSGISIELPATWKVDDRGTARNLLIARAPLPDKDLTGEFQTLLTIDVDTVAKLDGNAQQARVAKAFNNYKVVEKPTPITINGLDGIAFAGTFTNVSVKLRSRQYMLLQNDQLYILTFTALDSAWAKYAPAIEASAATFTIPAR
jgi:hypothetical protein